MLNLGSIEPRSWIGLLSIALLITSIYFTFNFFEYLKNREDRLRKQAKLAALICISTALLIPAVYNIFVYE